ncbi:hypothetical protein ACWEO1_26950 [Kitasatospora cineracea]
MLHVGWNIQHGWKLPEAIGLLKQFAQQRGVDRPHLLTLQELQEDQPEKVAQQLGLACVEAPNVRPGSRNALFYDSETFQPDPDWVAYSNEVRHRPATAKLRLIHPDTGARSRREMSVASIHLDFGDPDNRQHQIRRLLANMAKDRELFFGQGDTNGWTAWGCPLSLDRVADRAFAVDRSLFLPDGSTQPDDLVDRIMTTRHMTDVGRYAATVLGRTGADRATTWDGPKKGRQQIPVEDCPPGGLGPIDRTYVSRELEPVLLSSTPPATQKVESVSDHLPQVTAWDLQQLWEVMDKEVETVRH